MKPAAVLRPRVRQDIQARTDKVLRELGNPEPPLRLEDVRALLQLDRTYFTSEADGLLQSMVSKLKRGGRQILHRPTLLLEAVKKFDLRALYLPDHKRILIDGAIPQAKHRWLEAHEIGHDLLPWHHDMMLGDDDVTPTASTHAKMEAEANYAAGSLLFLGDRFREECRQSWASLANAKVLQKRYGNTITSTMWRMIEYVGEEYPIIGAVGRHPGGPAIEHALESLLDRRKAITLVAANQEIYHLLRDGFPMEFDNAQGQPQKECVHLINFNEPDQNRYLAAPVLGIKAKPALHDGPPSAVPAGKTCL